MTPKSRLIIALDVFSFDEMKEIVEAIGDNISIYKVGHQLFTAEGPKVIKFLKELGKEVFLDLKLHEIPNSVASAIKSAGKHGVDMVTVHASGGRKMMEAGVEAAKEFSNLKILALTVVTSLNDKDVAEIGFSRPCEDLVIRLAKLAEESGCHGVIASPKEIVELREILNDQMLIVTPGIRLNESKDDDQNRAGTPKQAIDAGASYIVIGRAIAQAQNPALSAKQVVNEIA